MTDILIKEIEDYCHRAGCKPSTFSRKAVNDGKFYNSLKNGRRYWPEMADRVRKYIMNNPPPADAGKSKADASSPRP